MSALPELFFRVRDNGAAVFRLDSENRDRRLEFTQIAVVNTNRGDFKTQGDCILTDDERAEISQWLQTRMKLLATRELDDIHRALDQINLTAQWAQAKATDAQLEGVTDALLLAMHDLRSTLVRKKSERLSKET